MDLTRILLDTSAYSAFKRGQPEVTELIRAAQTILLPATVIGELLAGFDLGARRERNRDELAEFCAAGRVQLHAVTQATAERYATCYVWLRGQGTPVPTNDLWIAAAAMETGAVVVTADRHFEFIPQVIAALI